MTTTRITTLANGLRVASEEMPSLQTASIGVWVGAGARNETAETNGVSHVLEHMAFKGTRQRSARQIAEEIEAVGGHLNAYTSREQTAYYAKVLKDDAPLAVDLLADILQNSVFDSDELARERTVILQEIGQANDTPDDIVFDHFQEAAYPEQPIGRPVLGTSALVSAVTRDMLHDYMGTHYRPSSMVVTAAGRIDHDRLVEMVGEAFGDLSGTNGAPFGAAHYVGGEFREERDIEQTHIILGLDSVPYGDPDFYAVQVLSTLLGGGMSSRLFQEVREVRGLAYSVFSFNTSYLDAGLFGIYAGTSPEDADEAVAVICDETRKVADTVSDEEVRRASAQLKAGLMMSLESSSSRCEQLARQILIFGRRLPPEEVVALIDQVDAATITRVAKRLLCGAPATLATLGPVTKVPDVETIRQRLM